jgi:hypothetical protein
MRWVWVAMTIAGLACGGMSGQALGNYDCSGYPETIDCPPASTCVAFKCDHPIDPRVGCGATCRANVACDPNTSTCPLGTHCDAPGRLCIPTTCINQSDCAADAICLQGSPNRFSHSLCVPIADLKSSTKQPCQWPLVLKNGSCRLTCRPEVNGTGYLCPTGDPCDADNLCVF